MRRTNMMNEKPGVSAYNPIRARHYEYDYFTYPWHFHNEYEINYVKKSFGLRFVGDSVEPYEDGDLILLAPETPHYLRSDEVYIQGNANHKVTGTNIQFEQNFMSHAIAHYPQFKHIRVLLEEAGRGISFPLENGYEIRNLVEQLPTLEGIHQITALLLLLEKMYQTKSRRLLASPNYTDLIPVIIEDRMEKILSYIHHYYIKPITLEEVSSIAAMNQTAFCRYFKDKTGKTFKEYILDLRIGYARKLLMMKDMPVSQICFECGFATLTHFNRIFKRSTGYTPSGYRAKMA